jgi:chemotaxis response regulator CheB
MMGHQRVAHDVIVIGGSAGALEPLTRLLGRLPADLPACVLIVVHLPVEGASLLFQTLRQRTALAIGMAVDGERLQHGRVYLPNSDNSHLLVEHGFVRLEESPKEVLFRPSIDALFRSAAFTYGRRAVGVVLSGALNDGTAGLWQIKKHGGVALVQDPHEATFPAMPQSAVDHVAVDHRLPVEAIAWKLVELATNAAEPPIQGSRAARLLVVENESSGVRNLERRLRGLGYDIAGGASTGEHAIERVGQTYPDLVLMDVRLAGAMSGTEATQRIWERFQIPVVYVTAYTDDATLEEVKRTEHYGYVVKPVRPRELHAAIQLALARREKEMSRD